MKYLYWAGIRFGITISKRSFQKPFVHFTSPISAPRALTYAFSVAATYAFCCAETVEPKVWANIANNNNLFFMITI